MGEEVLNLREEWPSHETTNTVHYNSCVKVRPTSPVLTWPTVRKSIWPHNVNTKVLPPPTATAIVTASSKTIPLPAITQTAVPLLPLPLSLPSPLPLPLPLPLPSPLQAAFDSMLHWCGMGTPQGDLEVRVVNDNCRVCPYQWHEHGLLGPQLVVSSVPICNQALCVLPAFPFIVSDI